MKEILFSVEESSIVKQALEGYKNSGIKATTTAKVDKILNKIEKAETRIKTSSAKAKGRNLQYWVCDRIAKVFKITFNQSDDTCPIHSREMGQHGTDIVLRGEIYNKFPFDVECKAQESLNLSDWVRQAQSNVRPGRHWLLVFKKKTIMGNPLICTDWDTFEELFRREL